MSSSLSLSFCLLTELEIRSIIWSHRGLIEGENFDATTKGISLLIEEGILNFDVDVSVIDHVDENNPLQAEHYLITHPLKLKEYQEKFSSLPLPFQTVQQFLNQIHYKLSHLIRSDLKSQFVYPFVTLEPKFTNLTQLHSLLLQVLETPLGAAGHVALIVRDDITIQTLQNWYLQSLRPPRLGYHRVQPIAIAYRSYAPSKTDLQWKIMTNLNDSWNYLPQYLKFSNSAISFKQIHMPDVQLLPHSINDSDQIPFKSKTYNRVSQPFRDSVVSWIVDSEELLLQVLHEGRSDMIITNRPIQLLRFLREYRTKICS